MSVVSSLIRIFMESRAANSTMGEMIDHLAESGQKVEIRFRSAEDTPKNRNIAGHIIGIERWGQKRMTTVLGKLLDAGEYDHYRPETDLPMTDLSTEFSKERQQTLALVEQIRQIDGSKNKRVYHNDFGEISVGGWLTYLNSHAEMESKKIR